MNAFMRVVVSGLAAAVLVCGQARAAQPSRPQPKASLTVGSEGGWPLFSVEKRRLKLSLAARPDSMYIPDIFPAAVSRIPAAPKKLARFMQLFIGEMSVAEAGDFRICLRLELK